MYKNKKILIVDDFESMRKIIRDNLLSKGVTHILQAENGKEALQILNKNKIDLLITDLNMPVMSGIQLINEVRLSKNLYHLPVLMITAETTRESIEEALLVGVNEFIVKPFTPVTLYQKLDSIFSGNSPISNASDTKKFKALYNSSADGLTSPPKKKNQQAEILVVDDLASNIDVIVGILKNTYKIKVANSGQKALKIVNSDNKPDLILLDIMMPEMSGLEVCKKLKENPLTENIPVVFLTAKTDYETILKGFELGAVDYINKPVEPDLLKVRVKNHIKLKQTSDELKYQVDTLMENSRLREDVERISRHDLKNPLGLIINQSAQLLDDVQFPEKYKEQIKQIEAAGTTILGMVNSSLNIYKMETNNYEMVPEDLDIIKVINKVKNDMLHVIDSAKIAIEIITDSESVIVKGEDLLCYSILSNLIKNAVEASKFMEVVSVYVKPSSNNMVTISIHNSAVIPESVQTYFFGKYVTSGKKSGTGLGTYSAKLMTEIQNGKLTFLSSVSQGTTIKLVLPASE